MAARKKSDAYLRLEAAMEGLIAELVRGLVELLNTEVPAQVRAALDGLHRPRAKPLPPKRRKKRSSR